MNTRKASNNLSRRELLSLALGAGAYLALPVNLLYAQQKGIKKPQAKPYSNQPQQVENLEQKLLKHITRLRQDKKLTPDEKIALSSYDFTSGKKLVAINEEAKMQAASMIKPFIALAYFHKVARGELKYDRTTKKEMEQMIRRSNNYSTNLIIKRIGGPSAVQNILKNNYGVIFRNTEVVQYIPEGGVEYKNKASARDYSRFLYAMWQGNLPYSEELKRLMSLRKRNRIISDVMGIPDDTLAYDKTGSTARLCGDMGIIEAKGKDSKTYPYTVIAVIEKANRTEAYRRWIKARGDVIREISSIVYKHMKTTYKLI